jgi:hypothetical protein
MGGARVGPCEGARWRPRQAARSPACSNARSPKVESGDFHIDNDSYGGGQHLQNVFIFTPIFVDGRIILSPALRQAREKFAAVINPKRSERRHGPSN